MSKTIVSPGRMGRMIHFYSKNDIGMDGESCTEETQETGDSVPDPSDIFQPARFRRSVCSCDEIDRFLLGYGFDFLLPFGAFLWAILANYII